MAITLLAGEIGIEKYVGATDQNFPSNPRCHKYSAFYFQHVALTLLAEDVGDVKDNVGIRAQGRHPRNGGRKMKENWHGAGRWMHRIYCPRWQEPIRDNRYDAGDWATRQAVELRQALS